jgi:two-component system, NtrC family, C4-dicarboxylate transport response regulator DctD
MATFPAKFLVPEDGQQTALLVSPAEEDHETLEHVFDLHGWSLQVVSCLDSAAALLGENSVSVVITERDLPGGSWRDVLRTITALPRPPLVIVISQMVDDYLWAEALNLGVHDVLAKPLVHAEVVRVLASAWIQANPEGTSALLKTAVKERRTSQRYKAPRSEERERMEQELLAEIRVAGEVYLEAAEEYARISREYRETLDHSDGSFALHEAARNEQIAFEKYNEVLDSLTQLILRGRPAVSLTDTES